MSTLLLNLAFLLFAGFGCLLLGALILNEVPLHDPPGMGTRLRTYLTTNVAETSRGHQFPELELRCYRLAPDALYARIERAAGVLGWEIGETDPDSRRIKATIESRLLRFRDDIDLQLRIADCGTELHIRSSSRIGRGDFGANTRHIIDLHNVLASQA